MIDLEHVSKEYKRGGPLALDDINLHVDDGEFVFLLGHSGAGKSTLLKLLLREELPSEGKVTVLGKDVAHLRRRKVPYLRRQMGVVFQDFRLIPTMTVYENVAFAMRVTNINNKTIKNRVPFALSLVGLEDKMDRLPDELSGGAAVGGAYHPALGELVRSRLWRDRAERLLTGVPAGTDVSLAVAANRISVMTGQHRANVSYLQERFALQSVRICAADVPDGEIVRI